MHPPRPRISTAQLLWLTLVAAFLPTFTVLAVGWHAGKAIAARDCARPAPAVALCHTDTECEGVQL